jgi:hypothetical protein
VPIGEELTIPPDADYIEGAIDLCINGSQILSTAEWDYIDQLWAYIAKMLVDLSKGSQVVETRFPDQPVIFQIKRVSGGMLRISCSYGEVSREASAREERVLAAMRQAGLDFYSRMLDLVPSNFERYAHPMEMLSSE